MFQVCLLLLTAGVHNVHDAFVSIVFELENKDQQLFYEMMPFILNSDRKLENITDELYTVLFKKTCKYITYLFS